MNTHDAAPAAPAKPKDDPTIWCVDDALWAELPPLLGRSTGDLARDLGPEYEREVVHRDDLVLLRP